MESNSPQNGLPEKENSFDANSSTCEEVHPINVTYTPGGKSLGRRPSLRERCQEKKAKRIKFFKNGDKFYAGHTYVLSCERTRTFNALLEDLTKVMMDKSSLPSGVRYIFDFDGKKITDLSELDEGCGFVCSSSSKFVRLNYSQNYKLRRTSMTPRSSQESLENWDPAGAKCEPRDFVKPRLVNIIRNGGKPRKLIRFLLNRKTAHSFNQVLRDITAEVKLYSGVVRKVYALDGGEVTTLEGFFGVNDTFIVCGTEKCLHSDFELDNEELQNLSKVSRGSLSYSRFRRSLSNVSTPIPKENPGLARESSFCANDSSPACAQKVARRSKSLFGTPDKVPEEET